MSDDVAIIRRVVALVKKVEVFEKDWPYLWPYLIRTYQTRFGDKIPKGADRAEMATGDMKLAFRLALELFAKENGIHVGFRYWRDAAKFEADGHPGFEAEWKRAKGIGLQQ